MLTGIFSANVLSLFQASEHVGTLMLFFVYDIKHPQVWQLVFCSFLFFPLGNSSCSFYFNKLHAVIKAWKCKYVKGQWISWRSCLCWEGLKDVLYLRALSNSESAQILFKQFNTISLYWMICLLQRIHILCTILCRYSADTLCNILFTYFAKCMSSLQ